MSVAVTALDPQPVDPITVEIVGNGLIGIAKGITARMIRAAESLTLKEVEDCSAALFDARGRLIAESPSVPIHLSAIGTCLKMLLEKYFPAEVWRPGDVVITNDPYAGGGSLGTAHTNDFTAVQPVFVGGQLVAFAGLMVHHLDIGSRDMGGQGWNENIYQEGIRIPPTKIVEAGAINQPVVEIILNNSRVASMLRNDLTAQLTCINSAADEIGTLFKRYGESEMLAAFDALIDSGERRTRAEIAKIPDGTYSNELPVIDEDRPGGPFRIRVKIIKSGTEIKFDFTGTDRQVVGPINAPLAAVWSAILYALRCITDPSIPSTEGCMLPLTVIAPPGTMVNARPPAAVWQRMILCQTIVDLVMGALAPGVPDRVIADSAGCQYHFIYIVDAETSKQHFFGKNEPGGIGACVDMDGMSVVSPHLNNCPIPAIEATEIEHPVIYLGRELRPDSGGPGKYRGGLGQKLSYRLLKPGRVSFSCQKYQVPAQGRAGGEAGASVRWVINEGTEREIVADVSRGAYDVEAGDTIAHYTPGGGGFGPLSERDPAAIAADLRAGYVTR